MLLRDAEPADPEIHYMIALERAKDGDLTQALAGFDECIRLDPEFHYAYYHKAVTLDTAGRREEARRVAADGVEHARDAADPKAYSELTGLLDTLQ